MPPFVEIAMKWLCTSLKHIGGDSRFRVSGFYIQQDLSQQSLQRLAELRQAQQARDQNTLQSGLYLTSQGGLGRWVDNRKNWSDHVVHEDLIFTL